MVVSNILFSEENKRNIVLFISTSMTTETYLKEHFGVSGNIGMAYKNIDLSGLFDFGAHWKEDYYSQGTKKYQRYNWIGIGGGGIAFHYRKYFDNKYIGIFPGMVAGYWQHEKQKSIDTLGVQGGYTPAFEEDKKTALFGGPTIIAKVGYKRIFLTFEYTILIGNDLCNLFKIGIEFYDIYDFLKALSHLPNIYFPPIQLPF